MNQALPASDETDPGGRVFFSGAGRSLIEEDEIELTSVGVDVGSSTSHFLVSRIVLERLDTQYVVADRQVSFASEIMLTPYSDSNTIDAGKLGDFIDAQYRAAGLSPEEIDTGALILTGVAARRANARAVGELFAAQAGKFVAVSAGDSLETLMAAHGSGAVALSETGEAVLNIDLGGGTTKIALCRDGAVVARTALDVGARLVAFDADGRIERIESFGAWHLREAGLDKARGDTMTSAERRALAEAMARQVRRALLGGADPALFRLPPIDAPALRPHIVFSGGVAEYMRGEQGGSADLGAELAAAILEKVRDLAADTSISRSGIRATVVGASQYTVQVSGSTIFLDPEDDALPLTNLAVIAPDMTLGEVIAADVVARAVGECLSRLDLAGAEVPVAVAVPWSGSATYDRLANLARGLVAGLRRHLDAGHPLVLVTDGDIGGLLGMQARTEEDVPGAIVSIDGIRLAEFDFIDIGAVIRATGAAPVVVKSLLFPAEGA